MKNEDKKMLFRLINILINLELIMLVVFFFRHRKIVKYPLILHNSNQRN